MDQAAGAIKLIRFARPLWQMNQRRPLLRGMLENLKNLKTDIDSQATSQEKSSYRIRKKMVVAYFLKVDDFIKETTGNLDEIEQEGVLRFPRLVYWVSWIERRIEEAEELLRNGRELQSSGLTTNEVRKRGDKLPVRDLNRLGVTASSNLYRALDALTIRENSRIGIYGCPGAGKKTLMKHIYNRVLDDRRNFEAVYWAEAPAIRGNYDYAVQERVSEGMWLDIKHDTDCVRRASMLEERFKEIAESADDRSKCVILFLGNLRQEFRAYEVVGLSAPDCVLVFTAPSLDVCNRMKCNVIIKVDHLLEEEARELFMTEAGLNNNHDGGRSLVNNELEIKCVAARVANECARMPLAIRVIANSMREIKDILEWRNRLTELLGTINAINNEEDKILEQLRFSYFCLEDASTRSFFEVAARVLADDVRLSKEEIIQAWRDSNLLGTGNQQPRADADECDDNQGHTMLNQLERLCLLEVESSTQPAAVSMNKWIRKIASDH